MAPPGEGEQEGEQPTIIESGDTEPFAATLPPSTPPKRTKPLNYEELVEGLAAGMQLADAQQTSVDRASDMLRHLQEQAQLPDIFKSGKGKGNGKIMQRQAELVEKLKLAAEGFGVGGARPNANQCSLSSLTLNNGSVGQSRLII
jgi:hypothetical protein